MMNEFTDPPTEALSGFQPFSIFVAVYLGLIVGSFLNVVIYRLPLQRSVVFPGSACGGCGVPLSWFQNLPLFSFVVQRGRCSSCGSPFSARYFLVELLSRAGSVGILYWYGGLGWLWLDQFALFAVAAAVFFTDLDHWIIPDEVNLFGVVFGLLLAWRQPSRGDTEIFFDLFGWAPSYPWSNLCSSLLGIVTGYAFFKFIQFLGLILARQEAMGEGDVKYAAVLGAFLGWQMSLVAFFLSFFLGALFALPLLVSKRGHGKDPIPFGTFMSLAAVPVGLAGSYVWEWMMFAEWI